MNAVTDKHATPTVARASLPAIGAPLLDGIYAGISLYEGERVALVLLPADGGNKNWKDACAWAGEQDAELPSCIDMAVLYDNVRDQFKEDWYWIGQEHPRNADGAWLQYFGDGYQILGHKGSVFRCRAVRRVAIQPFDDSPIPA